MRNYMLYAAATFILLFTSCAKEEEEKKDDSKKTPTNNEPQTPQETVSIPDTQAGIAKFLSGTYKGTGGKYEVTGTVRTINGGSVFSTNDIDLEFALTETQLESTVQGEKLSVQVILNFQLRGNPSADTLRYVLNTFKKADNKVSGYTLEKIALVDGNNEAIETFTYEDLKITDVSNLNSTIRFTYSYQKDVVILSTPMVEQYTINTLVELKNVQK